MPLHETRLICEATLNIETPPLIKQVSYVIHVNRQYSAYLLIPSSLSIV